MNKTSERIESILHNTIDKVAQVAVAITKAVVTLICLGAFISYRTGVKLGEVFYKDKAASSDVSSEQEVNVSVDDDIEQIVDEPPTQDKTCTLTDTFTTSKEIFDVIRSLNIAKPIAKVNYLEQFINNGLRDTLETNILEMCSYNLPSNKRVKSKTHIRHGDIGVLKEYYPVLVTSGTLR